MKSTRESAQDLIGDLVFNGVASDTFRSNSASGIQLDAAYKRAADHTVRLGGGLTRPLTHSNNTVSVFPGANDGSQSSDVPFLLAENYSKLGELSSVYVQDEWRIDPRLNVNYGLRFDHVAAFTNPHPVGDEPQLRAVGKGGSQAGSALRVHLRHVMAGTPQFKSRVFGCHHCGRHRRLRLRGLRR